MTRSLSPCPRHARPAAVVARAALLAALLAAGLARPAAAADEAATAASRGRLLYETHCIACHTKQMHWRDNRRATDWAGLVGQVRRWQGEAQLNWGEEDIQAVAHYLNAQIYHLPMPERRALRGPAAPGTAG